ncbi:metallophosphoesterase [Occallatibacter riparius]|uniref:Metallophosphoesterase n=1 Tax=Occallatibacter riparius TaxID=1002689 RepID=A0A9J7BWV0_9BACT|nr:metallophosphoesterase [Occallatibacter riparius]
MPYLSERVRDLEADVFVIAGDLANDLSGWTRALEHFHSLAIPKLVIPGNHDVWIESRRALQRAQDSRWKYRVALAERAAQQGFHYLPNTPVVLNGVGFAGSLGWYDYSFRDRRLDPSLGSKDYERGAFASGSWNDARYAVWLREPHSPDWKRRMLRFRDEDICSDLLKELGHDLDAIASQVERMVAIVHTTPFEACVERSTIPDPFDAYQGSARLGEVLTRFERTHGVAVICGHIHASLKLTVGGVRVLRSPVGYLQSFDGDYYAKAREAVGLFEI